MNAPAAPVRRFALPATSERGHRLVFDLVERGMAAFQLAATTLSREGLRDYAAGAASPEETRPAPKPAPKRQAKAASAPAKVKTTTKTPVPARVQSKWTVFIDAGHGGKDPGAIGRSKTQEKEITLAAAQELAKQLQSTGLIRPVLSRSDDRYLKLGSGSIWRANRRRISSFHSVPRPPLRQSCGISVFTLSDTASDKEAELLAANENKADLIGGPDLAVEDPEAADELLRMFQRKSMSQSTFLAKSILQNIRVCRW